MTNPLYEKCKVSSPFRHYGKPYTCVMCGKEVCPSCVKHYGKYIHIIKRQCFCGHVCASKHKKEWLEAVKDRLREKLENSD